MQQKYILRSEGTLVLRKGAWVTATNYGGGNLVSNGSLWYYCYAANLSSATNEPGTGADWEDFWEPWGLDADHAYLYIAYASDASGTNFTLTFDPALDYIAVLPSTTEKESPVVGDFAGLWKNYKGAIGEQGAPGGEIGNWAIGEIPSGTRNGTNKEFTLAETPAGTPAIYFNGLRQKYGTAYTNSGTALTLVTFAPDDALGDEFLVDYPY